jgi:hypothetical protein
MKVSACFPSKYLKAADIEGHEVTVQIAAVKLESMEQSGDTKPVLYFVGKSKGVVLNKTNSETLSAAFGDESDGWIGRSVVLFGTTTQFGGKMTPCIRLRIPRPPAIAAPVAAVPAADTANAEFQQAANSVPPSDDIPF